MTMEQFLVTLPHESEFAAKSVMLIPLALVLISKSNTSYEVVRHPTYFAIQPPLANSMKQDDTSRGKGKLAQSSAGGSGTGASHNSHCIHSSAIPGECLH